MALQIAAAAIPTLDKGTTPEAKSEDADTALPESWSCDGSDVSSLDFEQLQWPRGRSYASGETFKSFVVSTVTKQYKRRIPVTGAWTETAAGIAALLPNWLAVFSPIVLQVLIICSLLS